MTRTDESLLKQVAALEAYMDDLQKKVEDLCEYKMKTISLISEMKQVRSELRKLWKMHTQYQGDKVLLKSLKGRIEGLKKRHNVLSERHNTLVNETLMDYADIRDAYKTIKRAVIIWLVVSFLGVIAISFGVNIYLG